MEYKIGINYNGFVLVREENIKEVNSSIKLKKSFSFWLAIGYIVLSLNVIAFKNVFKEPFTLI